MTENQLKKMHKLVKLGKSGKLTFTKKNKKAVINMIGLLAREKQIDYLKNTLGINLPDRKGHVNESD